MELPSVLRAAVDQSLEGISASELARAAEALSQRYRAETRDGTLHLADDIAARAYLAVRLPATYAAIRASMSALAGLRPDFAPGSMLDVGAGPGSALWAAADCWPGIDEALLVEASAAIRAYGVRLAKHLPVARVAWRSHDVAAALPDVTPRDLVTLAYVLDELEPAARDPLVDRLWSLTADTLLIVEPGTPAGWQRVLHARDRLITAGAHLVAPCPHAAPCPLAPPDWCHFSRRVARSRLHLRVKDADVPWEDEKFVYIAASRHAAVTPQARVIAHPRASKGLVSLKLCQRDGTAAEKVVTRRDGDAFKLARRADWGDALGTG
jgi:ribosomal protein RSM22 (predicted rRNA methylase)